MAIEMKCTCDVCRREINPNESERFVISLGKANWFGSDTSQIEITKDCCEDCYNTLYELVNGKPVVKIEPKAIGQTGIKEYNGEFNKRGKPRQHGYTKWDDETAEKFKQAYIEGHSKEVLMGMFGLNKGQAWYQMDKLRKAGIKPKEKNVKPKATKPMVDCVVDRWGFVVN